MAVILKEAANTQAIEPLVGEGYSPITTGIWESPEAQARQMKEQEAHVAAMRGQPTPTVRRYGAYVEADLPTF